MHIHGLVKTYGNIPYIYIFKLKNKDAGFSRDWESDAQEADAVDEKTNEYCFLNRS